MHKGIDLIWFAESFGLPDPIVLLLGGSEFTKAHQVIIDS